MSDIDINREGLNDVREAIADPAATSIGPHVPDPEADLCCAEIITCAACGRPLRKDGQLWRADIDGLGAELACYPEYSDS